MTLWIGGKEINTTLSSREIVSKENEVNKIKEIKMVQQMQEPVKAKEAQVKQISGLDDICGKMSSSWKAFYDIMKAEFIECLKIDMDAVKKDIGVMFVAERDTNNVVLEKIQKHIGLLPKGQEPKKEISKKDFNLTLEERIALVERQLSELQDSNEQLLNFISSVFDLSKKFQDAARGVLVPTPDQSDPNQNPTPSPTDPQSPVDQPAAPDDSSQDPVAVPNPPDQQSSADQPANPVVDMAKKNKK